MSAESPLLGKLCAASAQTQDLGSAGPQQALYLEKCKWNGTPQGSPAFARAGTAIASAALPYPRQVRLTFPTLMLPLPHPIPVCSGQHMSLHLVSWAHMNWSTVRQYFFSFLIPGNIKQMPLALVYFSFSNEPFISPINGVCSKFYFVSFGVIFWYLGTVLSKNCFS